MDTFLASAIAWTTVEVYIAVSSIRVVNPLMGGYGSRR